MSRQPNCSADFRMVVLGAADSTLNGLRRVAIRFHEARVCRASCTGRRDNPVVAGQVEAAAAGSRARAGGGDADVGSPAGGCEQRRWSFLRFSEIVVG